MEHNERVEKRAHNEMNDRPTEQPCTQFVKYEHNRIINEKYSEMHMNGRTFTKFVHTLTRTAHRCLLNSLQSHYGIAN